MCKIWFEIDYWQEVEYKIRPSGDRRLLSRVWKFSTGEGYLIGMVTLKLNQCSVHANTLASVKMMDKLRKKILAKDNVPEKRDALSDWMRTIGR